jgi:hypothetical protein
MLIWKGHGILILVFSVIASVAASLVVSTLFAVTHWAWMGRLLVCAPFWGAAAAIWLYAKTMGQSTTNTYLDPATHQPVVIRNSHTLFFIPPVPWAILATIVACAMSLLAVFISEDRLQPHSSVVEGSSSAKAAFVEANRLITIGKGQQAFGNTPDAERLAAEFSEGIKLGRQIGVQAARKKSKLSFSNGQFLTYCRINPDSCAFMVHVPDLRKFKQDAKDYMIQVAWAIAMKQVNRLHPQPLQLAVGIRGAFLYDAVYEGSVLDLTDDDEIENEAGASTQGAAQAADEDEDDEGEDYAGGIELRHNGIKPDQYLVAYFEPHSEGAVLPTLSTGGEVASAKTQPSSSVSKPSPLVQCTLEEVDERLRLFAALKPGQCESNTAAVRELAASYADFIWSRLPPADGTSEPCPRFSAYLYVVRGTAVFMLGLPEEVALLKGTDKSIPEDAWATAMSAAEQMVPRPARIAVILYQGGRSKYMKVSGVRRANASTWNVLAEIHGGASRENFRALFNNAPGSMDSVPSMIQMPPATPQTAAAAPQQVQSAAAPVSASNAESAAPSLPTQLRDWKDTTGRVIHASLESFTSAAKDTGSFKRADGQAFEVPFARLSAEDQAFIRNLAQKLQ